MIGWGRLLYHWARQYHLWFPSQMIEKCLSFDIHPEAFYRFSLVRFRLVRFDETRSERLFEHSFEASSRDFQLTSPITVCHESDYGHLCEGANSAHYEIIELRRAQRHGVPVSSIREDGVTETSIDEVSEVELEGVIRLARFFESFRYQITPRDESDPHPHREKVDTSLLREIDRERAG